MQTISRVLEVQRISFLRLIWLHGGPSFNMPRAGGRLLLAKAKMNAARTHAA